MENAGRLFGLLKKAVLGGCVYCTVTHYLFDFWVLSERSMEPTLQHGEVVLSSPSGRLNLTGLRLGDVIIFRNPTHPKQSVCKRIKGLPGDRAPPHAHPLTFIPAGQVWVEGDNLNLSRDSRTYGPIPLGLVQGRVICRVWPVDFQQPKLHSYSS